MDFQSLGLCNHLQLHDQEFECSCNLWISSESLCDMQKHSSKIFDRQHSKFKVFSSVGKKTILSFVKHDTQ